VRWLEALKQEQQRLLQLSYRDVVDDEVTVAEQVRIRSKRAQVAKWAKKAERDADDIAQALEEALRAARRPRHGVPLATPVARRTFNQALFERLLILDDEVIQATLAPWVRPREDLARGTEAVTDGITTDAGLDARSDGAGTAQDEPWPRKPGPWFELGSSGADERTRTSTSVSSRRPERRASANSATSAGAGNLSDWCIAWSTRRPPARARRRPRRPLRLRLRGCAFATVARRHAAIV
jgi:hypothetical protein